MFRGHLVFQSMISHKSRSQFTPSSCKDAGIELRCILNFLCLFIQILHNIFIQILIISNSEYIRPAKDFCLKTGVSRNATLCEKR